jgi:hypothetical protein
MIGAHFTSILTHFYSLLYFSTPCRSGLLICNLSLTFSIALQSRSLLLMSSSILLWSIVALMLHHHHALVHSFNPFKSDAISSICLPTISIPSIFVCFNRRSYTVPISTSSYVWLSIICIPSSSDRFNSRSSAIFIPSISIHVSIPSTPYHSFWRWSRKQLPHDQSTHFDQEKKRNEWSHEDRAKVVTRKAKGKGKAGSTNQNEHAPFVMGEILSILEEISTTFVKMQLWKQGNKIK